ncbi:recombinase family protein [Tepidibacter formicigenes]|uniref:Site-specific DNA recombinase n=1 Tax=Tepidibacter formicigenes DSM 15518 TaxID=1123349 RepID=A0A1M6RKF0_9FIRM|nr:recombinase family protein [Tepidibacter formicigenes]SHK32904.1 Site-specific DNA recombinase [Tepidibacter formicigenes DSM 15518]
MGARNYAYLRISSKSQKISRQLDSIKNLDIDERDTYIDEASGKNFDRPAYQALKRSIREGDTLFIKSLDRFGRNKEEILKEWQWLIDNKINIVVLDMPLLDTRRYESLDGIGELVTSLVLQILSWLAEEERKNIKTRQREGIDSAMKRGVRFGRPKVEIDEKFIDAYNQWKKGEIMAVQAMKLCNMKKATFYNRAKEYEERMKEGV